MSTVSLPSLGVRVRREHRAVLAVLVLLELVLTVAYFALTTASTTETRYLVYPFVWINVGVLAVLLVRTPPASPRRRAFAATLAAGYFVLLMAIPGNVGLGAGGALDVRVAWLAPGWGPLLAASGPVHLYLIPFEVVGYGALASLVYANALRFDRSVLSGTIGLATCVGCTVPLLAPLLGVLGGPATGLASTAYAWSYDVGTVLFVLTVWLLLRGAVGARSDAPE